MLNQLVGLIVGCILFFRGITFFVNKTYSSIAYFQEEQQRFTTQSTHHCKNYLANDARKHIALRPSTQIVGSCFRERVIIPQNLSMRQKVHVVYRRYTTK